MTTLSAKLAVLLVCALCPHHIGVDASAVAWSYANGSDVGPALWKDYYTDCGGVMQSPIDIDTEHVLYDPDLEYFNLSDYTKKDGVKMELHNVGGHTAEVKFSGEPIYLRSGSLPDLYQVDQFHFHWGKINTRGSEHSVDKTHFPMEMHIVHHQVHLSNISSAMSHPYGLAVLGFFFKVRKPANPMFEPLLRHFDKIATADSHVDIPTFSLSDLVGNLERMDYFRYMGSLTTPPCYESVIWSLASEPIEISIDQMNKFRQLQTKKAKVLVDDYRPIQERHSRTVTTTATAYSGSGTPTLSLVSITMAAIFSMTTYLLSVL